MKKFFPNKIISFEFDKSFSNIFNHKKLSAEELFIEFNEFIWANNISKEDESDYAHLEHILKSDSIDSYIIGYVNSMPTLHFYKKYENLLKLRPVA